MTVDVSELGSLVADLTNAPKAVIRQAAAIVERGALNVKNDARRLAQGIAHAPHYPASISYDVKHRLNGNVEAEIGPDKGMRQGALGNVLEYGTSKNAPIPHLQPALDLEGPRFEQALADAAGDIL